ncbi:MAG: tRNA lysidine(34) synthetase TilS [Pseudomonadota bacterium]
MTSFSPIVIPSDLKKTIDQTIDDYQMLKPKDSILVAVSGGPDSVALTFILTQLQQKYQLSFGIAHLNHQLRGVEAARDELFVKKLAHDLGLFFHNEQKDTKAYAATHRLSIEEAGRKLRYAFFNRVATDHGYTRIATGHTKDDNAELVLMNLIRGSGAKGLSGIPPIRQNLYIRPMIQVSKKQILDLLKKNMQPYMIDSSNTDPAYLRNRIRHSLIPLMQSEYNPEIVNALNRLSRVLGCEDDFFEQETQRLFHQCLIKEGLVTKRTSSLIFLKSELAVLHPALVNRILRMAIKRLKTNLNRISMVHMENIVKFCFHPSSGQSLDLPGQIRIYKTQETIEIKKEDQPLREIGKQNKKLRRRIEPK